MSEITQQVDCDLRIQEQRAEIDALRRELTTYHGTVSYYRRRVKELEAMTDTGLRENASRAEARYAHLLRRVHLARKVLRSAAGESELKNIDYNE